MALYGIISDIHGNLEALHGALTFLREREVDRIVCLGDIVGYNAEPDACVELLQREGIASVTGNHDLMATGALGFERCAVRPTFALRRTRRVLEDATRRVLETLPSQLILEDDVVLVHGGFRDVCQYVSTPERVQENHALMLEEIPKARICFHGHTHEQRVFEIHKGVVVARAPEAQVRLSGPGRAFFVNPGSIDAARKEAGERRAELCIFDSSRRVVSFHRLPYDHARVERDAMEGGYRMTPMEERFYRMGRTMARRASSVWRGLGRMLPFSADAEPPPAREIASHAPPIALWAGGGGGRKGRHA